MMFKNITTFNFSEIASVVIPVAILRRLTMKFCKTGEKLFDKKWRKIMSSSQKNKPIYTHNKAIIAQLVKQGQRRMNCGR